MNDFFKMADLFMFQLPRKIVFGNGAAAQIGVEAKSNLPGKTVFLVTDHGVVHAGLADTVISSLEKEDFKVHVFDQALPDSPIKVVMQGVEQARIIGVDLIVRDGHGVLDKELAVGRTDFGGDHAVGHIHFTFETGATDGNIRVADVRLVSHAQHTITLNRAICICAAEVDDRIALDGQVGVKVHLQSARPMDIALDSIVPEIQAHI